MVWDSREDHIFDTKENDSRLMLESISLANSIIQLVKRKRPAIVEVEAILLKMISELPEMEMPNLKSQSDDIQEAIGGINVGDVLKLMQGDIVSPPIINAVPANNTERAQSPTTILHQCSYWIM